MTKVLSIATFIIFLTACDSSTSSENSNISSTKPKGKVTINLAGKEIHAEATCSFFEYEGFTFTSDDSQIKDTNGDGILITGNQSSATNLALSISLNGEEYSAANLSINKSDNGATGNGKLFHDIQSFDTQYEIDCS